MSLSIEPVAQQYFDGLRHALDIVAREKCVNEGLHRQAFRVDGEYADSCSMALLKQE